MFAIKEHHVKDSRRPWARFASWSAVQKIALGNRHQPQLTGPRTIFQHSAVRRKRCLIYELHITDFFTISLLKAKQDQDANELLHSRFSQYPLCRVGWFSQHLSCNTIGSTHQKTWFTGRITWPYQVIDDWLIDSRVLIAGSLSILKSQRTHSGSRFTVHTSIVNTLLHHLITITARLTARWQYYNLTIVECSASIAKSYDARTRCTD
jgi:hypothetical protein